MINRFIFTGLLFLSSFFVQATVTVTQTSLPAGRGDTDQRILLINITNQSGTLNLFTINLGGTTTIADITNIKIYSTGTSNRFFSTKTLFGSASAATGNIDISGSRVLNNASNNYFWLVYDVAAGAAEGNLLDAICVSYRRNSSTTTLTAGASNPSGSSPILLAHKVIFKSNDVVTDGGSPTASQYFRIPAIITAANGDIITATDARFGTAADLPAKADIIIRRSTDNGQTWLAPQTIADYGTEGAGDASFILDKTNGNILCFFASHNGLLASRPWDPIRLNVVKSTDNGATWGAPVDITDQIYGSGCSNPTTQNWYAVWASAGRHTQLSNGRLVVAVGVSATSSFSLSNTIIYSDDGGTTWTPVTTLTNPGAGDESHIVELNNGNLMMSSRINVAGKRKYRVSTDLGATWGAQSSWSEIDDSRCNGDFVRYSSTTSGENMSILLHTIPASGTRQNLTVFASQDEGATWPVKKKIFPLGAQYSSITRLADGSIGLYYEMADPGAPFEMYFARFSLNWLGISGFITLPVNFIDFSGRLLPSGEIKLDWKAATDNEHSYFEVERSSTQQHFTTIGKVESPYTFLDQHPLTGVNYYRIKAVNKDGKYQYSKIIKIVYDPALAAVSIHPNPATDRLTVELKKVKQGNITLQVSDLLGRIILEKNYTVTNSSTTLPVETASWKPQLYFLKVIGNDGKLLAVQKFIKQ